jgi:hypothetical protein
MEKKLIGDFTKSMLRSAFLGKNPIGSVEMMVYGDHFCETKQFGTPNNSERTVQINEVQENDGINYEKSEEVIFECPSFNNIPFKGFVRVIAQNDTFNQSPHHKYFEIKIISSVHCLGVRGETNQEHWSELEKFANTLFDKKYPQKTNEQHFLNELVQTQSFGFKINLADNALLPTIDLLQRKEWELGFAVPISQENEGGYLRLTTNHQESEEGPYFLNSDTTYTLSRRIEEAVTTAEII